MITPKQIGLVHVARARLRLDEADYRDLLQRCGGVASAKDLDAAGFHRVMEEFARLGFSSAARKRQYGRRPGMASPAQLRMLWKLWGEWSASADEASLNKWLERSYHVSAARFLTAGTASKAINGLRAMARRKKDEVGASPANGSGMRSKG